MAAGRSEDLLGRAARSDAWAASRAQIREVDAANLQYPQYAARAEGSWIWDADGRRYDDFILGYGPVVLGHADARVNAAVQRQMETGICVSPMWTERQIELTELLCAVIPGAERAFLMRTGSDATTAAVRLARIHTRRDMVLKWGYNGWHDWTAPRPAGVPGDVAALTLHFRYNDIASVERAFAAHPGKIACLIVMPFEYEAPEPGFLARLKAVAHAHGALFVIDDMRSGFRIALGGAQEYFGVTADLATFSKAMANGFVISAVTGRADVMAGLGETHMSSTFFANPAEMAAAIETISIIRDEDVPARLWQLADRFDRGLRDAVGQRGLPVAVEGLPISPFLRFLDDGSWSSESCKRGFYRRTLEAGVMFHPNHQWYFCSAHSEAQIDRAVEICGDALDAVYADRAHCLSTTPETG
jgi:glutamate-1-semialdehyde aminotransferase